MAREEINLHMIVGFNEQAEHFGWLVPALGWHACGYSSRKEAEEAGKEYVQKMLFKMTDYDRLEKLFTRTVLGSWVLGWGQGIRLEAGAGPVRIPWWLRP